MRKWLVGLLAAGMCAASAWATTDTLDREFTGVSGTSYVEWSDKEGDSGAVYAGQSAGGNDSIQLRSNNNNSGIVTTGSGGTATKVTVAWNENTSDDREVSVYGKADAYSAATDLYSKDAQGTLIGSIKKGESTELSLGDGYEFIGLRSKSGALYLDSVAIEWSGEASPSISYTGDTEASLPGGEFSIAFTLKNYVGEYGWTLAGEGSLTDDGIYTWAPTEAGEFTIKVSAVYEEELIADKEVTLKVNPPVVVSPITIGEIANGSVVASIDGETVTVAPSGATVTLSAAADAGYKFSSMSVTYGDTVIPFSTATGTFEMPGEEVFVSAEFVERSGDTFTKIAGIDELEEGDYVIVGAKAADDNHAMLAQVSGGTTKYLDQVAVDVEDGSIVGPDDAIVWSLAKSGDNWTIYNSAVGFAGYVASGNSAGAEETASDKSSWTISAAEGVFSVWNVGNSARQLLYNQSSPRFACYTNTTLSSTYRTLDFYKKAGPASPSIAYTGETEKTLPDAAFELVFTLKNYEGDFAWSLVEGEGTLGEGGVYTWTATEPGEYTIKVAAINGELLVAPQKEVTLKVNGPVVVSPITIGEIANGSVVASLDGETVTVAPSGVTVTLTASAASGYKFSSMSVTYGDTVIPFDSATGTFEMPGEEVFVSAEFIEKPVVAGFTKITSLDELTEGEYVITGAKAAGEEYAMKASVSTGNTKYLERRETAVEIEEDVVTDAEDSIIWTLAQGANGWTIYNEAVGYAGYVASGNSAGAEAEASAKSSWTITASTNAGLFLVDNVEKEGRYLLYNASQPRFACYTNLNSGKHLALYKGASGPSIAYTGETEKTLPDAAFELVFTLKNYEGNFTWSLVEGEGSLGEGGVYTWTATAAGENTIKVAAVSGELLIAQKQVKLTVNAPVVKYQIACAVGIPNGSVSADKTEAEEGELVTLTASPAAGYKLEHFLVNDIAISENTFPMPAEDVLVSASFVEITGETYVRVESADDFEEGAEYLIVAYSKDKFTSALKNEANGTRIGVEEVVIADDNTVTTESDAIVWKIQAGAEDGQYVLFNEAKDVYAAGPNSEGNNAQLVSDEADALAQWTLDFSGAPAVAIGSVAYSERQLNRNSTAQYNYFATYKGSGTKPFLFKKAGPSAPKIVFDGETTIELGEGNKFDLNFRLENYDGAFEWVVDSREGGSIDQDGHYEWEPTEPGEVTIKIVARDGELDIASKEVPLTVTEPGPQPGEPAVQIAGPDTGAVDEEVSCQVWAINMENPVVFFEGEYEVPDGSSLTGEDFSNGFDGSVCTFTPDVAGVYWIEFTAYESDDLDTPVCSDRWTITVSDEPGPQPTVFQITGLTKTGDNLVLTFAPEGTPAVLGTASLASPQEWTPVEGAAVSGTTATVPMGDQRYITLK